MRSRRRACLRRRYSQSTRRTKRNKHVPGRRRCQYLAGIAHARVGVGIAVWACAASTPPSTLCVGVLELQIVFFGNFFPPPKDEKSALIQKYFVLVANKTLLPKMSLDFWLYRGQSSTQTAEHGHALSGGAAGQAVNAGPEAIGALGCLRRSDLLSCEICRTCTKNSQSTRSTVMETFCADSNLPI